MPATVASMLLQLGGKARIMTFLSTTPGGNLTLLEPLADSKSTNLVSFPEYGMLFLVKRTQA